MQSRRTFFKLLGAGVAAVAVPLPDLPKPTPKEMAFQSGRIFEAQKWIVTRIGNDVRNHDGEIVATICRGYELEAVITADPENLQPWEIFSITGLPFRTWYLTDVGTFFDGDRTHCVIAGRSIEASI